MTTAAPLRGRLSHPRLRVVPAGHPRMTLSLMLVAPLLVAAAAWSYSFEFDVWRTDVMQAADRAGLYLFLVCPGLAGVTAWASRRGRLELGELAEALPAPALLWRRAWVPYAAVGVTFHALVVAALTMTSALSGGVGTVDPFPVAVQFLSIGFFCAVGAWTGGHARSELAAPGVFVVLLALNTVLVQYGFRRISDVGTGSADFLDLRMNPALLAPKALLFLFLSLSSLPLRAVAVGWRRHGQAALGVGALVLLPVVLANPAVPQVYTPGATACHSSRAMQICVPTALAERALELDAPVARSADALTGLGLSFPMRVSRYRGVRPPSVPVRSRSPFP